MMGNYSVYKSGLPWIQACLEIQAHQQDQEHPVKKIILKTLETENSKIFSILKLDLLVQLVHQLLLGYQVDPVRPMLRETKIEIAVKYLTCNRTKSYITSYINAVPKLLCQCFRQLYKMLFKCIVYCTCFPNESC